MVKFFTHKLSRPICNKITLSKYVIFKTIPEWNNLSGNILAACSSTSLPRRVRISIGPVAVPVPVVPTSLEWFSDNVYPFSLFGR